MKIKNLKEEMKLKSYVICYGGGRGGFDGVEEVKSELSIEGFLKDYSEGDIKCRLECYEEEEDREYERECMKDLGVGMIEKIESSKGFEVWGLVCGEEDSVWMFEGDVEELDNIGSLEELFEYLGI